MEINKMEGIVEAILFSTGESVHINKIAEVLGQDKKTTKLIIENMSNRYNEKKHGIRIVCFEESYQLCTKEEYYDFVKQITNKTREYNLTDVLIETLAIIAYKQPITRAHIEEIRGVNTSHAINKLIDYQLVVELGRMNGPGRPILFGTSEEFLRNFGLESLKELPFIEEIME